MTGEGRTGPGLLERTIAAGPELERDAWALSPAGLELVLAEVASGHDRVVECGSGVSTILIARLLRERRAGILCSLEHDPEHAALIRGRLAHEGLEQEARVVEAALGPDPVAEPGCGWYDRAALASLPRRGVNLLLVDGPPASPGAACDRSRYPALPLLADRLATGASVILDDAQRPGEAWVLERWQHELRIGFRRHCERIAIATWDLQARLTQGRMSLQTDHAEDGGIMRVRIFEGCMLRDDDPATGRAEEERIE